MWVHFGDSESDDRLFIQEVKSTGQPNLGNANGLIDDYSKLFQIHPRFSLRSRITVLKSKICYAWKMPELAERCSKFVGTNPVECAN